MTLVSPPAATAVLGELSRILWHQRQLLELLEFRLQCQQLVHAAGNLDHLHLAVADVEAVLDDIRRSEDQRLGVVAECAVALGLGVGSSLRELATAAPEPWTFVLEDHQTALLQAVTSSEALASANRELANRGLGETRRAFEQLDTAAPVTAYGRHGDRPSLALPPTLVDRDA